MTTSTVTPEIVTFAQGVRAALADLPADEVDDLTDGLEADLAEAYAEDLQRELPDPSAYAAELRLAAGLPVRTKVKHGVFAGIGDSLRETRRDIGIAIRGNSTLAGFADFLITLRPVWWVLRAWLATWLVASFFGSEQGYWFSGFGWYVLLATFIAVSVQWGRGKWRGRGVAPLIVIGNIAAIVAFLPVMVAAENWGGSGSYEEDYYIDQTGTGITLDQEQISNIFAYGPDGKLLKNVQLFDETGRPFVPLHDPSQGTVCSDPVELCDTELTPRSATLETGAEAWNVFPLSLVPVNGEYEVEPGAAPVEPKAPFLKVPAVMLPEKKAEPKP